MTEQEIASGQVMIKRVDGDLPIVVNVTGLELENEVTGQKVVTVAGGWPEPLKASTGDRIRIRIYYHNIGRSTGIRFDIQATSRGQRIKTDVDQLVTDQSGYRDHWFNMWPQDTIVYWWLMAIY